VRSRLDRALRRHHDDDGTAGGSNALRLASDDTNEVVATMQSNSINRDRINWTDLRAQVFSRRRERRPSGISAGVRGSDRQTAADGV
jgi:hypothetical protein